MLLSRREYAKHRGVAVSAVQKAIETGRITLTDGKADFDRTSTIRSICGRPNNKG